MLFASSGAVRIGASRVVPRAASIAAASTSSSAAAPTQGRCLAGQRTRILNSINTSRSLSTSAPVSYATTTNPNPPLSKSNATNTTPAKVALIGARGYTGSALVDLLNNHDLMDLRYVSSRELAGTELQGYSKRKVVYDNLSPEDLAELADDIDCVILALPNGVCGPFVEAIDQAQKGKDKQTVIVDLSADYRFDNSWTYGLPELTKRSDIAQSTRISNPGCYATAAQLALAPILELIESPPVIMGVSGYSGAGTKASKKNDVEYLTGGILPYSLTGHIHEKEVGAQLSRDPNFAPGRVCFIPHVSSWFRGIHHTIHVPLNKSMTSRDIRNIYQERYAGEKLIKVVGETYVKDIQNKHGVEIGGFAVDDTGRRVVITATIDNLNKGASSQCLQNMNLALGYDEFAGIPPM